MASNTINQKVKFNASTHKVYELLMDEKKHAAFTKASASIVRKVGGRFSVWDGYATGENLELISDKRIVQTWRASDWPEDAVSRVIFELSDKNGLCELKFTQSGVPEEFIEDISNGWKDNYWILMKEYLTNH